MYGAYISREYFFFAASYFHPTGSKRKILCELFWLTDNVRHATGTEGAKQHAKEKLCLFIANTVNQAEAAFNSFYRNKQNGHLKLNLHNKSKSKKVYKMVLAYAAIMA